jgi:hypothetical protein
VDTSARKFVKQYRAEITLSPETTCTLTSANEDDLLLQVRNVLGTESEPRIEQQNNTETSLIYHKSHLNGTQPVGWIAAFTVPQPMSVKNLVTQRFAAQKAA